MEIIGNNTIAFKTVSKIYAKEEETGFKNNTARMMTKEEVRAVFKIIRTSSLSPVYNKIVNSKTGEFFYKYIRDFSYVKIKLSDNSSCFLGVFTWYDTDIEVCSICGIPVESELQKITSIDKHGEIRCTGCE